MKIRRFIQGFIAGLVAGLVAFLIAILFILFSPSSVSPETATEIFRVLSEIDGVLIGFTGIITIFLLKETPKRKRKATAGGILFAIVYFIGSVLFNLHGLMHVNSASISSWFLMSPIALLFSGIFILAFTLYRVLSKS